MVVPFWNRALHIKQLLENLATIVAATNEVHMKLWIADFKSTDINLAEHVKMYTDRYPIQIVTLNPPFVIGKGLQIAAETIPAQEEGIIYFCDADSVFPNEIFARIRQNVIKGKTFYAPLVSREDVNGIVQPTVNKGGKGNIGIHSSDFIKSKGWRYSKHMNCLNQSAGPMQRTAWGGHDGHIYEVFKYVLRLRVVRPIETDQWVRYHSRDGWFNEFLNEKIVGRRRRR